MYKDARMRENMRRKAQAVLLIANMQWSPTCRVRDKYKL